LPKAHLVFSDDPGLFTPEADEWLAPPVSPLEPGVVVEETLEAESLTIRTNRPGHPLLVKMAYHPRWRAEGASGPFLAAPALMVVVPQQETVVLRYARTRGDRLGLLLSVVSLLGAGLWAARQRYARGRAPTVASAPRVVVAPACSGAPLSDGASDFPPPPRRWGGALPAAVLGILVLARFLHTSADRFAPAPELYERASRAYAEERFADAAEYARHAITRSQAPLRDELLCLRGESLLREGEAQAALDAFSTLLSDSPQTPYAAQALFSRARAREAVGDTAGAAEDRRRLRDEHPGTPWAGRLDTHSAQ
jgi:hypothetical protein